MRIDLRNALRDFDDGECDLGLLSAAAYAKSFEEAGLSFVISVFAGDAFSKFGLDKPSEPEATAAINDMLLYMEQNFFNLPNYYHQDGLPFVVLGGGVEEEFKDNFEVFDGKVQAFLTRHEFYENLPITNKTLLGWDCQNGTQYCAPRPILSQWNNAEEGIQTVSDVLYDDGVHLLASLNEAKNLNPDYIYLASWNFYAMFRRLNLFEPTREFGNSQLTVLSQFLGTNYSDAEFKVCTDYYIKRKALANDAFAQLQLDQIKQYLISNQIDKAIELNAMIELE